MRRQKHHIVVDYEYSCYGRTVETGEKKKEVGGEQGEGGIKPVYDCEFSWSRRNFFLLDFSAFCFENILEIF